LRTHILPGFTDHPVAFIETVVVRRFMAEKQSSGLAPKSLQKIRLGFRQVLELARTSGAINTNPCSGIRLPRSVQAEPIFLTQSRSSCGHGRRGHPTTFSSGSRLERASAPAKAASGRHPERTRDPPWGQLLAAPLWRVCLSRMLVPAHSH